MSSHISFICDHSNCQNDKGAKAYIPIVFDKLSETWHDAIEFVRAAGWHVETGNEDKDGAIVKSYCPKHKPQGE